MQMYMYTVHVKSDAEVSRCLPIVILTQAIRCDNNSHAV